MATITDIIRERALANGADPDTLLRVAQVESGLNPGAQARSSSAGGLFQFVDGTWRDYGNGGDRFDPYTAADAGARLLRDNSAVLQKAGIEPTGPNAYLAHFSGAGTAAKLLKADDATPVASILSPQAVQANPFLAKMSVGDLRTWAAGKMTSGGVQSDPAATSSAAPQASFPVTGMLSLPAITPETAPISPDLSQLLSSFGAPSQEMIAAAPPPPPIAIPRRVDPAKLRLALQTPLSQRGFSLR